MLMLKKAFVDGASLKSDSYGKLESLMTNVAIMGALMTGIALSSMAGKAPGENPQLVFNYFVCEWQGFREFVIHTKKEDASFQCVVSLGNTSLDICTTVLDADFNTVFNHNNGKSYYPCLHDKKCMAAAELLFEHFPVAKMFSYILLNPLMHDTIWMAAESQRLMGWSAAMLTLSVLVCFFGLLALKSSMANTDQRAMDVLLCLWYPATFVAFVFFTLGLSLFFVAHGASFANKGPFYEVSGINAQQHPMEYTFLPVAVAAGILCAMTLLCSWWSIRHKYRDLEGWPSDADRQADDITSEPSKIGAARGGSRLV